MNRRDHESGDWQAQPHLLILHGTSGHPGENWFPWLAEEASAAGWHVSVPRLPTPDGQNLERWRQEFHYQVGSLSTVTAAVGHSLGVAFILRLIEEAPNIRLPILISVAGCIEKTGILLFDELNQSFIEDSFRWREIRERVGRSIVIYSDDDPYVSQSNSEALARSLAANTQVLHQSGHINAAAGYVRLPAIMRYLHPESVRQASDV